MKRNVLFFFLGIVAVVSIAWFFRFPSEAWRDPKIAKIDAVEQLKNILKLGVVELHISQIYEVRKDNFKIYQISIPWTDQKSIIAVKGAAQIGYDLEKAEFHLDSVSKKILLTLPEPALSSLDLDFHFIQEEDTFLRRHTPEDRNKILEGIKTEIRNTLLTPKLIEDVTKRTEELVQIFSNTFGFKVEVKKKT